MAEDFKNFIKQRNPTSKIIRIPKRKIQEENQKNF